MRFDCGPDWAEKRARLEKWHDHFALIPRKVADHDCRWFETIERRGEYVFEFGFVWFYRAKK